MNREGMRQAAVLLASLHPRDRAWIKQRLPASWWLPLSRLSKQARSLAPAHANVLRDALLQPPTEAPEPPTPDVLLAGLDGLPPAWVARALVACAPDHRELYLAARPTSEQQRVERALHDVPSALPPRLAEAVAKRVRQRGERSLAKGTTA